MKKLARQSLSLLVSNGAYMTARELSEVLGVSRRALLYSLDTLDDELVAAGLSITERVTNKGIRIVPAKTKCSILPIPKIVDSICSSAFFA